MNNRLIVLLIFLLPSLGSAAYGLADWQHATPGGHTLYDAGNGTTLALRTNHAEVQGITEWYFYKHHIIGKTHSSYFIINETNEDTRTFPTFAEWDDHINGTGLKPRYWTRWHTDNWRFYEQMIFLLLFLVFFIFLPLLTYFVFHAHKWITSEVQLKIKWWPLVIASGLVLLSVFRYLLDLYPQSY